MKSKKSMSLALKGLCLGLALLTMESLFVGGNAWLLTRAEEESARQRTAKEVIARASDLIKLLYNAGEGMSKYAFGHDAAALNRYETSRSQITNTLGWLRRTVADDGEQSRLLAKIETNINSALVLLADMKKVSESDAQIVAMQYGVKMQAKLQAQTQSLVQDMLAFLNSEKKIESASPAALRLQRERMKWLLLAGMIANIFTSVLLASLFVSGITSRLAIVFDNSLRLRAGEKLRPPLRGNDEISQLDEAFHNMSQSLRGEEELLRSGERQLRALIDQMPIGLLIIDEANRIEYANPCLEKMLDYKSGTLTNRRLADHFAQPGKSGPFKTADIKASTMQINAIKRGGEELPVEFSLSPTPLTGFARQLAVVIDISERLAMEKMRQAFVSMVSHELRTPLTSVAGFLQLLPMGVYGQVTAAAMSETKVAENQVDHLIALINDLLDLEKMQASKQELTKVSVPLEDAVDAAISAYYEQCEAKKLTVLFEGCENQVSADADALLRVISKMLEAIVMLAPSGAKIEITATTPAPAHMPGPAKLSFICPQLNLPPEQLASIFQPFQQVGTAGSETILSLGLPLAEEITKQHGGRCGADSLTGGGTALWLQLP